MFGRHVWPKLDLEPALRMTWGWEKHCNRWPCFWRRSPRLVARVDPRQILLGELARRGAADAHPLLELGDGGFLERERVLRCLVERRRQVWEDSPLLNMDECLGLAEQHFKLGVELPPGLRGQTEAALDAWLLRRARGFRERPDEDLSDLSVTMARARAAGLSGPSAAAEEEWESCAVWVLDSLEKDFSAVWLRRLAALAAMAPAANLTRWRYRAQNRFLEMIKNLPPEGDEKVRLVGEIDEAARLLEISADA